MAAGMQIFDAQGRLVVDLSTRLIRWIGNVYVNGAGSVTDSRLSQGNVAFVFQQIGLFYHISGDTARPNFNVSGNTISWSYSAGQTNYHTNMSGWLFFGVY